MMIECKNHHEYGKEGRHDIFYIVFACYGLPDIFQILFSVDHKDENLRYII